MRDPACACAREVRGSLTPCLANTNWVYPEQSNPEVGDVPPHLYFTPMYRSAVGMTAAAEEEGGTVRPDWMTGKPGVVQPATRGRMETSSAAGRWLRENTRPLQLS